MYAMREAVNNLSKDAYSEYSILKNIVCNIHANLRQSASACVDLKTTSKRPFSSTHHRIQLIHLIKL